MPYKPKTVTRNLKGKAWKELRAIVLREEDFCARCGQAVDKSISGRLPDGAHIGHIVSARERPDLELVRSNLQLEHNRCNVRSGS